MLQKFQAIKRLIVLCLVTLLLVTSALTISPTPARADNDFVIVKCESGCGNMGAFAAGALGGSAVTLFATGHGGLAAAGITAETVAIGQAATAVVAPLAAAAAPAMAAAAPILVPIGATAAVGYGAYQLWDSYQKSQAQPSK
jgi:hypothetical protein